MDNTAVQRFDSTKFYVRKPSRKFGAIEPPFAVLIVGKFGSGSIALNFLKGSPSEHLVLSNRPLFVVSVCYG